MSEHKARHPIGKRRLADAVLANQHEGVRHAAAAIGAKERGLGTAVTEEFGGHARRGGLVDFRLVRAHEVASARRAAAATGRKRVFTACQICFATVIFGALASMMTQRCGSDAASVR